MRSVADGLRSDTQSRLRAVTPAERVEMAFRLGDADLEAFMCAHGLARAEALAALQRARRTGRRPSACAKESRA
jgi:hypothetical protein